MKNIFNKILVPTDFSSLALNAIQSAATLVKKSDGEMVLLHVQREDEITKGNPNEHLNNIRNEYSLSDLNLKQKIISNNELLKSILQEKADLIITGTHGARGLEELFKGSLSEKIAKNANSPVIIVKNRCDLSEIKTIVYASDLRYEQSEIIDDVKKLQAFYNANLHLVKVYDSDFLIKKVVKDKVNEFAIHHNLQNYTANAIEDTDEAVGILRFADKINAQMVAIATHERHGLEKFFGGMITKHVVNHAEIPIWTKSIKDSDF